MEDKERDKDFDRRIDFVVKHYRDGVFDADIAWNRFSVERSITRKSYLRRHWMGIAAALIALFGLSTWLVLERDTPDWVAVETKVGQLKDVYLPDSTLVALAGNSSIRYDAKRFNTAERAVEMRGRAFFDVHRDENRPFSINLGDGEVRVLGTSFQVDNRSDYTKVEVKSGKVSFSVGEENAILTAGMSAKYYVTDKKMDVSRLANSDQSWRSGKLLFNDTPLDMVMDELSGFYGVDIVNDIEGGDLRLTATFNGMSIEEVIDVINQTLDVRLRTVRVK